MGQAQITGVVWLLIALIVIFSIAIALFKDMPDAEGDRVYNIATFTLLLGPEAVFQIVRGVLFGCYVAMIGVGCYHLVEINSAVMIGGHTLLLLLLGWRSQSVELSDSLAIKQFYQFIWRLFCLEYLVFPLAVWPWG
ncbi:MAG: UbiA family prenyltransferase [Spirulina sp. SIO3F2]|nr:UbiA family prenyltransferase [Spirulina sp. SIO3F2]